MAKNKENETKNEESEQKGMLISSLKWGLWLGVIILAISLFQAWNSSSSSSEDENQDQSKTRTESVVKAGIEKVQGIKLEPNDSFAIDVSSSEWSPWIDGSKKNMYYNVVVRAEVIYQFLDGSTQEFEGAEDEGELRHDVFRIRTKKGKYPAFIQASMEPIR